MESLKDLFSNISNFFSDIPSSNFTWGNISTFNDFFSNSLILVTSTLVVFTLTIPLISMKFFSNKNAYRNKRSSLNKPLQNKLFKNNDWKKIEIIPATTQLPIKNRTLDEIFLANSALQSTVIKSSQFLQFYNAMLLTTSKKQFLLEVAKILSATCAGKFASLHINPNSDGKAFSKKKSPLFLSPTSSTPSANMQGIPITVTNNIYIDSTPLGKHMKNLVPVLVSAKTKNSSNPLTLNEGKKELQKKKISSTVSEPKKFLILPLTEPFSNSSISKNDSNSIILLAVFHISVKSFSSEIFLFYLQLQKAIQTMLKNFVGVTPYSLERQKYFFSYAHMVQTILISKQVFSATYPASPTVVRNNYPSQLIGLYFQVGEKSKNKTSSKSIASNVVNRLFDHLTASKNRKKIQLAFYYQKTLGHIFAIGIKDPNIDSLLKNLIEDFKKTLTLNDGKKSKAEGINIKVHSLPESFFHINNKGEIAKYPLPS